MSNSLDPDQTRHFVGPDLGTNCLQRLFADNTSWQRAILEVFVRETCFYLTLNYSLDRASSGHSPWQHLNPKCKKNVGATIVARKTLEQQ